MTKEIVVFFCVGLLAIGPRHLQGAAQPDEHEEDNDEEPLRWHPGLEVEGIVHHMQHPEDDREQGAREGR